MYIMYTRYEPGPSRKRRKATCHKSKRYWAKGLCYKCYMNQRQKAYYARHRSAILARHKQHRKTRRGFNTYKRAQLKLYYNMPLEEYYERVRFQKKRCVICLRKPPVLVVDHCHKANRVRALLCGACNLMLGASKDNHASLMRGAQYLKWWRIRQFAI